MRRRVRRRPTAILLALGGVVLAGCWGGSGERDQEESGGSIDVAIVDTPDTQDLAHLTPSLFTASSHITVNYTILDEGTLREVITSGVTAARGRQFDVVMIGPYEAPQFGKDGYVADLTGRAAADEAYDVDDIVPSVRKALSLDGKLYAAPFYGESSFLMYRKDVLAAAGVRCRRTPPGTRSRRSPGGSTRPPGPASACAASRAGASWARRSPPC
jgi:sorbitol/mannitol transport system substrate-binding protein